MKKNEKLEANILTPTTKAADHDLPISGDEVCDIHLILDFLHLIFSVEVMITQPRFFFFDLFEL